MAQSANKSDQKYYPNREVEISEEKFSKMLESDIESIRLSSPKKLIDKDALKIDMSKVIKQPAKKNSSSSKPKDPESAT